MTMSDTSPADRMSGFISHLRTNNFLVGPAETMDALTFLQSSNTLDIGTERIGLKVMLCGNKSEWDKFDDLFDAYWFGRGVRTAIKVQSTGESSNRDVQNHADIWKRILPSSARSESSGLIHGPGYDNLTSDGRQEGKFAASDYESYRRVDVKHLVTPEDVSQVQELAEKLARTMKYRLSRRRKSSNRGINIDLRRTIRRNISRGGDLMELIYSKRPVRSVKLVVFLDVSGSMNQYSRLFLAFVRGLLGGWLRADAFLFHTRLVRISKALSDPDHHRAMDRLTLMADGFGGGTKIGECLKNFNDNYAKEVLNSRSVVIIISDGYDTGDPEEIGDQLNRLKKRVRRIVWLNPLAGWDRYEPVARGMKKALPYLDLFFPANTLECLANLEPELAKL